MVQKALFRLAGTAAGLGFDGMRAVGSLANVQSARPAVAQSRPRRLIGRALLCALLRVTGFAWAAQTRGEHRDI